MIENVQHGEENTRVMVHVREPFSLAKTVTLSWENNLGKKVWVVFP